MRRSDISRRYREPVRRVESEPIRRDEAMVDEDNFYEAMPVATPLAGRRAVIVSEAGENRGLMLAERIVGYVMGIVEALLALRLLLTLFSDFGVITTANGFARFIYGLSDPLVRPFASLFSSTSVDPSAWTIAFAMLVYAIVGYAIMRLIRIAQPRDY